MLSIRGFIVMLLLVGILVYFGALPTMSAVESCQLTETEQKKDSGSYEIIIYHEVKKGESLESIARRYNVHVYQIRQWNNLKPGCIIYPGQILKIKRIQWPTYVGKASWYGPGFHGKRMANGEIYNQYEVLIAHRHLPLGLQVCITNLNNGKSIIAEVKDRGPYVKNKEGKYDREVDLSFGAAKILGAVKLGVIPVKIEPLG